MGIDAVGLAAGPLIGASIAAIGYLARLAIGDVSKWKLARDQRFASLAELQSLLNASRAAYLVQCDLRARLRGLLMESHPEAYVAPRGDDWDFRHCFGVMTEDERSLHVVIRSYTEQVLHPLNVAMLAWLGKDSYFRGARIRTSQGELFSQVLSVLQAHLLLWEAKFSIWIPDRPENCLVFLADEARHGVGFPRGIEDVIARILENR